MENWKNFQSSAKHRSNQLDFHNHKNKEELDDLEKYKKNRESLLYGIDFTAEKDVFGKEQNLDQLIVLEIVMELLLIYLMLSPVF